MQCQSLLLLFEKEKRVKSPFFSMVFTIDVELTNEVFAMLVAYVDAKGKYYKGKMS